MRRPDTEGAGGTKMVAWLRVLASGSSGNCSVVVMPGTAGPRAVLIDAGLSPRRTEKLLSACGLSLANVSGVLLTHLDTDHWNSGWVSAWPRRWLLWLGDRHAAYAKRRRLIPLEAVRTFADVPFEPEAHLRIVPLLASHDELGVAGFRMEVSREGWLGSLGFATDLGRVPQAFLDALRGVDVLAIESNYCPRMQMASARPWHVKQRIMGGHGHLSNEQALEAIHTIAPREHVVLLHLSRQCNDPGLVASMHAGSDYALTISSQETATRWVGIPARTAGESPVPVVARGQMEMFPTGMAGGTRGA
jgi:phosphoribosyl 1,2-cyclic phosphodiesterase